MNGAPVGFDHLSDILAELDPVADLQRAFEQQHQPAEEVAQWILQCQTEDNGTNAERGDQVAEIQVPDG
jgi:hypothetical protein